MKAVILGVGRGNRMGDIGNKMPKCLVKYKGRTLIERALQILINCGINDITIVVGYKKDRLINHVKKSFPDKIIRFICNAEYLNKENIYSVWCAHKEFNHDLIMMDADLIFNKRVIEKTIKYNENNFIVVRNKIHDDEMIALMKNGRIIELSMNPNIQNIDFDYMAESVGIIKLSKIAAKCLIEKIGVFVKNDNLNQYYEAGINMLFDSINFSTLELDSTSIVEELDSINDINRLKSLRLFI